MKKLERRRNFFAIVQHHRAKRRASKLRKRRRLESTQSGYLILSGPTHFSLVQKQHRKSLLRFLADIRKAVIAGHKRIWLNLENAQRFIADGTLLFHSEICRLKALFPRGITFKCTLPRNPKAQQVLCQIGLLEELSYCGRSPAPKDKDVVNWRAATGQGAEGEKFENILGNYDGRIAEALSDELYRGLTEAMTNAYHHAYLAKRQDGLNASKDSKTWWMFSQERNDKLSVVFCDLGVGIPETLPIRHPGLFRSLLALSPKPRDSQIIVEAVKERRTRTDLQHRGKGLGQIIDTVSDVKDGRIIIFSNRGLYSVTNGVVKTLDYETSILGTVIFWQLPLPIKEDFDESH